MERIFNLRGAFFSCAIPCGQLTLLLLARFPVFFVVSNVITNILNSFWFETSITSVLFSVLVLNEHCFRCDSRYIQLVDRKFPIYRYSSLLILPTFSNCSVFSDVSLRTVHVSRALLSSHYLSPRKYFLEFLLIFFCSIEPIPPIFSTSTNECSNQASQDILLTPRIEVFDEIRQLN